MDKLCFCPCPPDRSSKSKALTENMEGSVFAPALEEMKLVKSDKGDMLTHPFLQVCKHILPVIDKFGAAMSLVKSDIGANISIAAIRNKGQTETISLCFHMGKVEVETNTAKASSSCTNGLLWLTRAMDFLVELFRNLMENPDWSMPQACTDSYNKTLKKWHGWLASSSFIVAIKLAPERSKFMEVLGGDSIKVDIETFSASFTPILQHNHKFLASVGLDNLKAW